VLGMAISLEGRGLAVCGALIGFHHCQPSTIGTIFLGPPLSKFGVALKAPH